MSCMSYVQLIRNLFHVGWILRKFLLICIIILLNLWYSLIICHPSVIDIFFFRFISRIIARFRVWSRMFPVSTGRLCWRKGLTRIIYFFARGLLRVLEWLRTTLTCCIRNWVGMDVTISFLMIVWLGCRLYLLREVDRMSWRARWLDWTDTVVFWWERQWSLSHQVNLVY